MLHLSTYFTEYFESINAIFWTVIVEVHFYILYPLLWWLLRRQSIWIVFGITFVIGLIYFVVASKYTDVGMTRVMQQHTTLVLFWKWVLGVVLAEIYWNKKPLFLLKIFNVKGIVLLFIVLSFVPEIFLKESIALQYERFVMPFISFMMIGVLLSENMRLTGNSILKWVGKISYSLYLWHPLVLLFVALFFENGGIICFGLALIASLAFAWVSYIATEEISINWGKKIINKN